MSCREGPVFSGFGDCVTGGEGFLVCVIGDCLASGEEGCLVDCLVDCLAEEGLSEGCLSEGCLNGECLGDDGADCCLVEDCGLCLVEFLVCGCGVESGECLDLGGEVEVKIS